MGHSVQVFIGSRPALDGLVARHGGSRVIDLPQGLALMPLTGELHDGLGPTDPGPGEPGFMLLDPRVRRLVERASDGRGLLYLETDYFGGHGTQGAIVARETRIVFGPARGPGTINAALRLLGVLPGGTGDEFEAVGLGRWRSNEAWMES